ncbi:hypothetical protein [Streptomyces aureus]|uniref:hypothetical protein n=1 Tax=Streptomyces aureus TaxID=193461 RepID=UPI0033E3ACC1
MREARAHDATMMQAALLLVSVAVIFGPWGWYFFYHFDWTQTSSSSGRYKSPQGNLSIGARVAQNALGFIPLITIMGVLMSDFDDPMPRNRTRRKFLSNRRSGVFWAGAIAASQAAWWCFWFRSKDLGPHKAFHFTLTGLTFSTVFALAALMLVAVASRAVESFTLMFRPNVHPLDPLAVRLAEAIFVADSNRHKWAKVKALDDTLHAIEAVARAADSLAFSLSRSLPVSDQQTRVAVRDDARAMAALIRKHKLEIMRGTSANSYDRVISSLWGGLMALTNDDWASLTSAATPVPGPTPVRAAIRRLTPVVVLISAGVLLPLLPQISDNSAVAGSLRVTLLVTAALALVLPQDSIARSPILEALGKAMPFKEK